MNQCDLIEEIRAVRHRISEAFGHDTAKLAEHYRGLEATKYADRVFVEPRPDRLAPRQPPAAADRKRV